MKRKNRMPSYYGKNIVQQVQRRYLRDREPESKKMEKKRAATADVICLCIFTALNDGFGLGEARLERVAAAASADAERFEAVKKLRGWTQAKKELDAEVKDLLPGGFLLPAVLAPKNNRDWAALSEQRKTAEVVVKFYAKALHDVMGFGADRLAEFSKATEQAYRTFGEWAEHGDWFGYNHLAQKMSRIIHSPCDVDESDATEPIFSNTLG